jgi:hypothetical protein
MVDADLEAVGVPPLGQGAHILAEKFAGWHQWSGAVTALRLNGHLQFE